MDPSDNLAKKKSYGLVVTDGTRLVKVNRHDIRDRPHLYPGWMDDLYRHIALRLKSRVQTIKDFEMIPVATIRAREIRRLVEKLHETDGDIVNKLEELSMNESPSEENQSQRTSVVEEVINTKFSHERLLFGDYLSWDTYYKKNGQYHMTRDLLYDDYYVQRNKFRTRIVNGETQILLTGIMSRNRKVFWMLDTFPNLEVPDEIKDTTVPNVAVNAWVILQIDETLNMKYELAAFEEVCIEQQFLVRNAIWNENDSSLNLTELPNLFRDEQEVLDPEFKQRLPATLSGIEGVIISRTAIVVPNYPRTVFRRIVVKDDDEININDFPPTGSVVMFTAEWLELVGFYTVSNVKLSKNPQLKPMVPTEDGYVKVAIRFCETYSGFYRSDFLNHYVDDVDNVLEAWSLSKFKKSTLQVAITDSTPDASGKPRYIVKKITDNRLDKIKAFEQSGELKIENEKAVIIDGSGALHVVKYPRMNLTLTGRFLRTQKVGSVLKISASYNHLDKRWTLTDVEIDKDDVPFKCLQINDYEIDRQRTVFRIPTLVGSDDFSPALYHPIFGVIQAPPQIIEYKKPSKQKYHNVLICLNDYQPGDSITPSHKFMFCNLVLPPKSVSSNVNSEVTADTEEVFDEFVYSNENDNTETLSISAASDSKSKRSEDSAKPSIELIEEARNNVNMPVVEKHLTMSELEVMLKREKSTLDKYMKELTSHAGWEKSPAKTLSSFIGEHEKTCESCRTRMFPTACIYPEFLGNVYSIQPKVVITLMARNLFDYVLTRRFR